MTLELSEYLVDGAVDADSEDIRQGDITETSWLDLNIIQALGFDQTHLDNLNT